jgi:hypothetical protein
MMGQQIRTESLFYYFRLEDQIPEDHLLRLIDQHIDLSFVRERLKNSYSGTSRPSIDPEVLLRLLLLEYLYGITSERRLLEEVRMHRPIIGSRSWTSSKRFRITRRSPRTGTGAFVSRECFGRCSKKSCDVVWRLV